MFGIILYYIIYCIIMIFFLSIHSSRGARDVEIRLDGELIFKGEIARACGGMVGGVESFGDTILFTTDEDILESVSRNDDTFEVSSILCPFSLIEVL